MRGPTRDASRWIWAFQGGFGLKLVKSAHELVSRGPEACTAAAAVGIVVERVETFAHPVILGGFDGPFDESTGLTEAFLRGSEASVTVSTIHMLGILTLLHFFGTTIANTALVAWYTACGDHESCRCALGMNGANFLCVASGHDFFCNQNSTHCRPLRPIVERDGDGGSSLLAGAAFYTYLGPEAPSQRRQTLSAPSAGGAANAQRPPVAAATAAS